MASILTNASAMTALKVLNSTNKSLEQTQARISTGLKVGSAKDNASFWAVSTVMKSDVSTFKAISDNLSLANNSTSVARDGAQQITKLIDEIKTKVTSAQETSIDKTKLQADIDAALDQIGEIVNSAQFNGVNLLGSDENVRLLSSVGRSGSGVDASYISFNAQNLSLEDGGGLNSLQGISVLDRGDGILKNASDGTIKTTFDVKAATYDGTTGKGAAGEKVVVKYKDEDGVDRQVSITLDKSIKDYDAVNNGAADFTALLKGNEELSKTFNFEANVDNLIVNAKRGSSAVFTSITVGAVAEDKALDNAQEVSLDFKDAPLRAGEEFKLAFEATDSSAKQQYELTFRVVNGDRASGEVLESSGTGTTADPYKLTLAIDAREVSNEFVTGDKIAAQFEKALDDFAGQTYVGSAPVEKSFDEIFANLGTAATKVVDYKAAAGSSKLSFKVDADATAQFKSVEVPQSDYDALLDTIEGAMQTAVNAAAAFGSAQKRVDIQQDFVKSLVNNLEVGIGTLVDADMNEESARLQALQVQQQLGIQALSIANQAPQSLLSLFR